MATIHSERRIAAEPRARSAGLRTLLACNIGVCLEGFDFIAYSAFAVVIARLYFPVGDGLASTLLTLGGFAAGYIARPIGGLFWGRYADRHGRRAALALTALLMAVGTAVIAVAPTYAAIGIVAPVLIVLARLLQGFAVSGEFASATAMLVEIAPAGRGASYASTQMATQVLTAAIAAGVVLALYSLLPAEAVESWGWRLIFGLGTLIGPLGLWMRANMAESPVFEDLAARHGSLRSPIGTVLSRYWPELTGMAGLIVISSAALYLIIIFLPLYAVRELGTAQLDAQLSTMIAASFEAVVILAVARLADRLGAMRVLAAGCLAYTIAAYPLFVLLTEQLSFERLLTVQLTAAALLGCISGPLPFAMSTLVPPEVRSTGLGLIYNVVGAVFGGLGPFVVTLLVAETGNRAAPGWWAVGTGLIGTIAAVALWRAQSGVDELSDIRSKA
jgi:MHS family proline/betaine transporter-like MFS transporter